VTSTGLFAFTGTISNLNSVASLITTLTSTNITSTGGTFINVNSLTGTFSNIKSGTITSTGGNFNTFNTAVGNSTTFNSTSITATGANITNLTAGNFTANNFTGTNISAITIYGATGVFTNGIFNNSASTTSQLILNSAGGSGTITRTDGVGTRMTDAGGNYVNVGGNTVTTLNNTLDNGGTMTVGQLIDNGLSATSLVSTNSSKQLQSTSIANSNGCNFSIAGSTLTAAMSQNLGTSGSPSFGQVNVSGSIPIVNIVNVGGILGAQVQMVGGSSGAFRVSQTAAGENLLDTDYGDIHFRTATRIMRFSAPTGPRCTFFLDGGTHQGYIQSDQTNGLVMTSAGFGNFVRANTQVTTLNNVVDGVNGQMEHAYSLSYSSYVSTNSTTTIPSGGFTTITKGTSMTKIELTAIYNDLDTWTVAINGNYRLTGSIRISDQATAAGDSVGLGFAKNGGIIGQTFGLPDGGGRRCAHYMMITPLVLGDLITVKAFQVSGVSLTMVDFQFSLERIS
jgi:hypothetical protein